MSFGNNVRIEGIPQLKLVGDEVHISFNLSWENSWRDDFNWDAVWLFVKYTTPESTDTWKHVKLTTSTEMPSGFISDLGKISDTECGGVFILRDKVGNGHVLSVPVTLKALRSNLPGITDAQIESDDVFVLVSAIEVVYIPYGSYYLGDGSTPDRLGVTDGSPYLVDDEVVINSSSSPQLFRFLGGSRSGSALTVGANFPKGYRGFYCMKYEVSQEQYVSFLNSLNRAQQKNRIGNTLDNLKEGEYVFGDVATPTSRNGICILSNDKSLPALFAHNLKQDDRYNHTDDGQTLACNFLTPTDMLAYCDWACLRPMSEMEYEKACRRPYPQEAVKGEYAWNNTTLNKLSGTGDMQNLGEESELPKQPTYNVNYGNTNFGPVRCGSFGHVSSTQTQSGATFWGLMEMSGNLSEICYNITATNNFNTSNLYTSHGNGEINSSTGNTDIGTAIWGNSASYFALKGGSYASNEARLRVSDRNILSVNITARNPEVGFRGVRTFGGSVVVNPGTITAPAGACLGAGFRIESKTEASVVWDGENVDMDIAYSWYISKSASGPWAVISGEYGSTLKYQVTENIGTSASVTYYFKRRAITMVGTAEIVTPGVTFPNTTINFSITNVYLEDCFSTPVTASIYGSSPIFSWEVPTGNIYSGAKYTPGHVDFSGVGEYRVNCKLLVAGCSSSKELTVQVKSNLKAKRSDQFTSSQCDGYALWDSRTESYEPGSKRTYCLVKVGTQCWMGENINVGLRVAGNVFNTHTSAGIQKICYGNNEANCDIYGGLYRWEEAVYGEKTSIKYVSGTSGAIQGLCPAGWHVPSDAEWKTLEMYLGMSSTQANNTGWRGTNQARQLKSVDYWTSYSGTTGTNSSGFNGRPGGYRANDSGGTFNSLKIHGNWWTSTQYNSTGSWYRRLRHDHATIGRGNTASLKPDGFSVRCLKN